jgi:hypothetical protein
MVHLVNAQGTFHARVIAARLGAEGIVTELRGAVDTPWPVMGEVQVLVDRDDLDTASALLLADQVEAVFAGGAVAPRHRVPGIYAWVVLVAVIGWVLAAAVRVA